MFSRRTAWDRTHNRLTELLEQKRRNGSQVLDLTESNPTRVGLTYPAEVILSPLAGSDSLRYDPDPRGSLAARQAVARTYADRRVIVDPEDLLLTASTSEAYGWLFKILADPGDEILIPQPSYPLFDYLARLENVEIVPYPLILEESWAIDHAAIERSLSPRSRAIVLVSPNNPTGSYVKRNELERLESLASERGIALIGDEVFAEYPHGDDPARAASVLDARQALVFGLGGLSKLAGLPQMKLGWVALGGAPSLRQEARERLELVADTYLSVNTPVQVSAARLLEAGRSIRDSIRRRVGANLGHLASIFSGPSPCRALPGEGGWSAVVQVPSVLSEEEWAISLLEQDEVLVHPGFFFDFPRPAYLVLSLLPEEKVFRAGLERIAARAGGRPANG
jgi:alanine-synthesizing transaminase